MHFLKQEYQPFMFPISSTPPLPYFTKTSHQELLPSHRIGGYITMHMSRAAAAHPTRYDHELWDPESIYCLFVGKNQLPLVVSTNRVRRSTIGRFR